MRRHYRLPVRAPLRGPHRGTGRRARAGADRCSQRAITMTALIVALLFAFLNRARGSRLYGLTDSTALARLVSTHFMGVIAGTLALQQDPGNPAHMAAVTLWTWGTLMLWCTPAWDAYWSAAIGNDPAHGRL